ncbi:acyl-CoA dehydratase activase-related protein [Myxococcota bacterium]
MTSAKRIKSKGSKKEALPDLFTERVRALMGDHSGPPKGTIKGRVSNLVKSVLGSPKEDSSAAEGTAKPVEVKTEGGRTIGIPAGLNFWENFPFWKTFFETCGFNVFAQETKGAKTLEAAKRYLNTDPCLPCKNLHGTVAELAAEEGVTDIFLPSVVEIKPVDERQKQAATCPVVQGAPHMIRSAFGAKQTNNEIQGKRLLTPELDFNTTDKKVLRQLKGFAGDMGVPPDQIKIAYRAAKAAQGNFTDTLRARGAEILDEIAAADGKRKGLVFLGRPYNSLNPDANMKLDRRVRTHRFHALPMDMLPLEGGKQHTQDLMGNTWYYQGKILEAAHEIIDNPDLYPVFIGNFKCGPDAFILKDLEDVMREAGRPMLVLELDELNSSAGYQTRIDAFCTSITLAQEAAAIITDKAEAAARVEEPREPNKFITCEDMAGKRLFLPRMSDHSILIAGALKAEGIDAVPFSPPNDDSLDVGRQFSNGKECLPFPIVAGEAITGIRKSIDEEGLSPEDIYVMFLKTGGNCRFSQYQPNLQKAIDKAGLKGTTVANLAWGAKTPVTPHDFLPSTKLTGNIWKSYVTGDYMKQILLENRPYEVRTAESDRQKAAFIKENRELLGDFLDGVDLENREELLKITLSDLVYQKYLRVAADAMADMKELTKVLDKFIDEITQVPQDRTQSKPLIGIVGEIYVRMNDYANGEIIRRLEEQGAEVFQTSISEFVFSEKQNDNPLENMRLRDVLNLKGGGELLSYLISRGFLRHHEGKVFNAVKRGLRRPDFGRGRNVAAVRELGKKYTGTFDAGEGPLTLGAMEEYALHGASGVVMVGPLGCLPNTVYEALIPEVKQELPEGKQSFPTLVVSMSESRNLKNVMTRIEPFVRQANSFHEKFHSDEKAPEPKVVDTPTPDVEAALAATGAGTDSLAQSAMDIINELSGRSNEEKIAGLKERAGDSLTAELALSIAFAARKLRVDLPQDLREQLEGAA